MRVCFFFLWSLFFFQPVFSAEEAYTDKVVVITVGEKDLVNTQSFKFWRRTLERVNKERAKAVIFQLDTPGGLAIETKDIMVNELRDLEVPSYALVDDEAISAGALISVATDEIWMTPGSTIGAAAIVNGMGTEIEDTMRAKLESFFEANVRAVTQDKGHPTEIVKMMMFIEDEDREYGPIKLQEGELLTLTAEEAVQKHEGKPILAQGIVKDLGELVERLGFLETEVQKAEQTGFEKLAWYIAAFSPVLILIGIGGAYVEMKAPGFGIGGGIALAAFGIFFFGNFVAGNLAGYELVALFLLGVVFIVVEVFIFPTMLMGVIGVLLVVGSLLFSMVDKFDLEEIGKEDFLTGEKVSWLDILSTPMAYLSVGVVGGIILVILLMRFLPHVPLPGFMLKRQLGNSTESGGLPAEDGKKMPHALIGKEGVALMDLRPTGKIELEGRALDVITRGEFLKKGTLVKVVAKEQMRTIVESCEPSSE